METFISDFSVERESSLAAVGDCDACPISITEGHLRPGVAPEGAQCVVDKRLGLAYIYHRSCCIEESHSLERKEKKKNKRN